MNDAMKERLPKVREAQAVLSKAFEELRAVCDHRDEVGSLDYYTDEYGPWCRICEEPLG